MRRTSEKGKRKEGRGQGDGADYKPYIQSREFGSMGTCSCPIDWKTGRTVELLSQGEAILWYLLRWNDYVVDIKEQYPLDLQQTLKIAEMYAIKHPHNGQTPMTTDFFVTYANGRHVAYSLKSDKSVLNSNRTVEKLVVEKIYWSKHGVEYCLRFRDQLNAIYANNIRLVVEYYNPQNIHDDASVLKHLLATKQIQVDMENESLDVAKLMATYEREISQWIQSH